MKHLDTGNFLTAWGGIASVSVALPVVWTGMRTRGFTLSDMARLLSQKPAQLAGLTGQKGAIAPGYDADFVVFDPERQQSITEEQLHTRHTISPYIGEKLFGTVTATYLRGENVFENGQFGKRLPGTETA